MRTASDAVLPESSTYLEPDAGIARPTPQPLERATYQRLIEHTLFLPIPLPLLQWLFRQALPHSAQTVWLTYLADSWVNGARDAAPSAGRTAPTLVSYLSVGRVAAQTGLPPETVRKANRLLVARGLLVRTERRCTTPSQASRSVTGSQTSVTGILIDPATCSGWLAAPGRRRAFQANPAKRNTVGQLCEPVQADARRITPAITQPSRPPAVSREAGQSQSPGAEMPGIQAADLREAARALRSRLGEDRYRRLTRATSPRSLSEADQAAYAEILDLGERARRIAAIDPPRAQGCVSAPSASQRPSKPPAPQSTAQHIAQPIQAARGADGSEHSPASASRLIGRPTVRPSQTLHIRLQARQALHNLKRQVDISDPAGLAEEIGYALTQGVFRNKAPRHGLAICLKLIAQNRWRTPYGFQRARGAGTLCQEARGGEGNIALH